MSESRPVWVVAERCDLVGKWSGVRWRVLTVGSGRPETPPCTVLEQGEGWARLFLGSVDIRLYPGETTNYLLNLRSARPALYVILRREAGDAMRLLGATVDPGEVDVHADSGNDLIEAVALPPDIAAWIEGFIAAHHVEQAAYRRKRDRADPDALGRKPRNPP
ncbi:MAG: DUF3305 domain-containing protein [Rhodospirillaceae bacterium]